MVVATLCPMLEFVDIVWSNRRIFLSECWYDREKRCFCYWNVDILDLLCISRNDWILFSDQQKQESCQDCHFSLWLDDYSSFTWNVSVECAAGLSQWIRRVICCDLWLSKCGMYIFYPYYLIHFNAFYLVHRWSNMKKIKWKETWSNNNMWDTPIVSYLNCIW